MKKVLFAGFVVVLLAGAGIGLRSLLYSDSAGSATVNAPPVSDPAPDPAAPAPDLIGKAPALSPALSPSRRNDTAVDARPADIPVEAILAEAAQRAEADPAAALSWAAALEPEMARLAGGAVLESWCASDPAAAYNAAAALEDDEGGLRAYALSLVIDRWADRDPAAAWTAAGGLWDARARAFAEVGVMSKWARQDPAAAAATLDVLRASVALDSGSPDSSAMGNLTHLHMNLAATYAQQDAPAARAWVESLPEGEARKSATLGLVSGWAGTDPVAASEWLSGLPAGPSRDAGIESLVHAARGEDPSSALIWADTIGDPLLREQTVLSSAHQWLSLRPDEARAWLEGPSGFPATEVTEILTIFEKMKDGTFWRDLEASTGQ